ncbi:hypothetical protein Dimus_016833 [Dionaea muscipula]
MAGKRGRPRKALALQRGSIVSRRGTTGVFEQIQTEGEEVFDCFAETSRDLGDRLADGEMVDLGDLGNAGGGVGGEKVVVAEGESIAPAVDLKGKLPLQPQKQAELSGGRREGVYLAAVQRGNQEGFQCKEWKVKEVQGSQTIGLGVQEVGLCSGGQTVVSSSGEGAVQKVTNEDKWQIARGHGSRGGQACLSTDQSTSQRFVVLSTILDESMGDGSEREPEMMGSLDRVKNKWKTRARLKGMRLIKDESCVLCQELRETTDHILFEYKFSSTVMHRVLRDVKLSAPKGCWRQWIPRMTTDRIPVVVGVFLLHGWDGLEAPSCKTASCLGGALMQ